MREVRPRNRSLRKAFWRDGAPASGEDPAFGCSRSESSFTLRLCPGGRKRERVVVNRPQGPARVLPPSSQVPAAGHHTAGRRGARAPVRPSRHELGGLPPRGPDSHLRARIGSIRDARRADLAAVPRPMAAAIPAAPPASVIVATCDRTMPRTRTGAGLCGPCCRVGASGGRAGHPAGIVRARGVRGARSDRRCPGPTARDAG